MIGFIGAMQIELDGIRALMTEKQSVTVSGVEYVTGKLGKNEIVTAVCGVGKVFAAVCAQTMILKFAPTLVINTGVAGGIASGLGIGDVVVAENVCQHDMDTSPIGDPVGLISGINKIYFETDKKASDALAASLAKYEKVYLVGDGAAVALPFFSDNACLAPSECLLADGESVGLLANKLYALGEYVSDAEFAPTYLRLPQAERERLEKLQQENIK